MSFISNEHRICYNLFVGPHAPPESMGLVGDIAVETQFWEVVLETANKEYARTVKGDKHEAHVIYYKTHSKWRSIDEDCLQGKRRSASRNKPYTIHPQLGAKFVLEEYTFRWRRTTSYFDPKSSTANNRQIEGRSPSNKRTLAAVTSDYEKEGEKRLRMETVPPLLHTTVDNTNYIPAISHEGNAWILKEYLLWNSGPISNIRHTHGRGRDILSKLLQLPYMIPHGRAMNYVRLLAAPDHGPITPKPALVHVIRDLIQQEKKTHISKINFGLGGAANHVSVEDVLASICEAGDQARDQALECSDPLLGALTIPATNLGLGKCSLTAGTFEGSADHVYECKKDKIPTWLSSINPRGSITDPHIDYCGCSQVVQHISGRKLWLFWPPTTHNLQLFCKKYVSGTNQTFSMMTAIEEFESIEILLVQDREIFVMPAGMIHAVITFNTSCHSGFKLWGFEDFGTARDLFNIHFEMWKGQSKLDQTQIDHYKETLGHLETTELRKWDELCQKNVGDERSQNVLSWIKECKAKLQLSTR